MCGTALGMSCNGAFSFWGPFFWAGAWPVVRHRWLRPCPHCLAGRSRDDRRHLYSFVNGGFFQKEGIICHEKPLNFAILKYMTTVNEACTEDAVRAQRRLQFVSGFQQV